MSESDKSAAPQLVAGTWFLEPSMPLEQFREIVERGRVDRVFVRTDSVAPNDEKSFKEAITFANAVWKMIIDRYTTMDPVVIGPVSMEMLDRYGEEMEKAGLITTRMGPEEYKQFRNSWEERRKREDSSRGMGR